MKMTQIAGSKISAVKTYKTLSIPSENQLKLAWY